MQEKNRYEEITVPWDSLELLVECSDVLPTTLVHSVLFSDQTRLPGSPKSWNFPRPITSVAYQKPLNSAGLVSYGMNGIVVTHWISESILADAAQSRLVVSIMGTFQHETWTQWEFTGESRGLVISSCLWNWNMLRHGKFLQWFSSSELPLGKHRLWAKWCVQLTAHPCTISSHILYTKRKHYGAI